jgi:hypothetical protein
MSLRGVARWLSILNEVKVYRNQRHDVAISFFIKLSLSNRSCEALPAFLWGRNALRPAATTQSLG